MIRIGVDVGGTFTDIILERSEPGRDQQVVVTKVSSTPHDQSESVIEGILKVCALAGVFPCEINAVFHGTTVATNMVIERSGAEVGMITTRGFRDILHMARHKRPHNFSLQFDLPWQSKPLVKRRNRLPVTERIMPPDGRIEVPLAQDEDSFRPVKVTAPLGSIFNPIAPAAAEARFSQIQRIVDLIIKALAPVLPDKCTAGNAAVLSFASYSGVRPNGDYWVFLEVNEAAMGGRPMSDGPDTVEELMRNTRNNPLEDLGMHLPLICDRYEVRDDVPPGAGKFRGGAGVVKSQRYLTPGFMTHESDRNEDVPWGIFGGKPGACSKVEIRNIHTGKVAYHPAKFSGLRTEEGDVVTYYSPAGGGYGDPLERDPQKVLDDVLDGFITVDHAREDYGVVLDAVDDGYGWALNRRETEALRAQQR